MRVTGPRGRETVHRLIARVSESTRLANVNMRCGRYLLGLPWEVVVGVWGVGEEV